MKINLSENTQKQIISEIKKSMNLLIYKYEKGLLRKEEYDQILFFCSEILNQNLVEEYNVDIEKNLLYVLEAFKNNIYSGNDADFKFMGMFRGIGNITISLNNINKKYNNLKQFSDFFNDIFIKYSETYLGIIKDKPLAPAHYDSIYGVSGILYYLLDYENMRNDIIVNDFTRYLIDLSKNKLYKGFKTINFHIEKEQQSLEKEKITQPDGHINFGIAHGMIGPLITLAKVKYLKYDIKGLDEAIEILFKLYEKFAILDDGVLKYPTQLPFQNYIENKELNYSFNTGWCYGNISIVRGLMKVSKYMSFKDKYQYYKEELLKIINQPIEQYNLELPILCHGYASVVEIQISAYKETHDKRFLNTLERNILRLIDEHKKISTLTKDNDVFVEDLYNSNYNYDFSLLQGIGGVTLTLIDSMTFNLTFDKLLMMD
ncbi:lanthionine synthetase LanC family protein [Clostridioides sp. ZZV15-6598]|uniref:lanthionine synthetase LanC family protein n=1 Tax=Clostridioides sp. ZZV15-6598 TaxID=2811501 RepID=UPI001D12BB5C|nr:hypothetical protein [Clostridioides sp. ZZV15-6598]